MITKGAQDMNPLKNLQFEKGDTPPEAVPYKKVDTSVDGKHLANVLKKALRDTINNNVSGEVRYRALKNKVESIIDMLDNQ